MTSKQTEDGNFFTKVIERLDELKRRIESDSLTDKDLADLDRLQNIILPKIGSAHNDR